MTSTSPASSRQSLKSLLDEALAQTAPFQALYEIAQRLRDAGLSQVDLYGIFIGLLDRYCNQRDERFNAISEVLDCIWGGGWGKNAEELFALSLSEAQLGSVAIQWEPNAEATSIGRWQIRHASFSLTLAQVPDQRLAQTLEFCLSHMLRVEAAEFVIGQFQSRPVRLIKQADSLFQFAILLQDEESQMQFMLGSKGIGEFIGGLMRASDRILSRAAQ